MAFIGKEIEHIGKIVLKQEKASDYKQLATLYAANLGGRVGGATVKQGMTALPTTPAAVNMANAIDELGRRGYAHYVGGVASVASKFNVSTFVELNQQAGRYNFAKQLNYIFYARPKDIPADAEIGYEAAEAFPQTAATYATRFAVSAGNRFASDTAAALAMKGVVAAVDRTKYYKKQSKDRQQVINTFTSSVSYSAANELLKSVKKTYPTLGSVTKSTAEDYGARIGENIALGASYYESIAPEAIGQAVGSVGALLITNPHEPIKSLAENIGFSALISVVKGAYSVLKSTPTKQQYDPYGQSILGGLGAEIEEITPELL